MAGPMGAANVSNSGSAGGLKTMYLKLVQKLDHVRQLWRFGRLQESATEVCSMRPSGSRPRLDRNW
jgi:hypothetical protein